MSCLLRLAKGSIASLRSSWFARHVLVAVIVIAAASSATAVGRATVNPPHGYWVQGTNGLQLVCDAPYYPVESVCLRPSAFSRAATPTDRPPSIIRSLATRSPTVRLVAAARQSRRLLWRVYLVDEQPSGPCLEVMAGRRYWGGMCFSALDVLGSEASSAWISGTDVILGLAADQATVVHLDGHPDTTIRLGRDRGFIAFCSNCCRDLTKLRVYAHATLLASDNLRGFACK